MANGEIVIMVQYGPVGGHPSSVKKYTNGSGSTSIAVTLSGHSQYIIVARGFDSSPSVSGCGATHLYTLNGQRHGVTVYLCTTSGTATITSGGSIEGYCVVSVG